MSHRISAALLVLLTLAAAPVRADDASVAKKINDLNDLIGNVVKNNPAPGQTVTLPAAPAPEGAPPAATASTAPPPPAPDGCAEAVTAAETAAGIPAGLMTAISLVESGRRDAESGQTVAWPWTINLRGDGHYYASKAEVMKETAGWLAKNVGVIDVGCMQIDLYHHPTAFQSLSEAFDPAANATYAARFLKSLYAASGSWNKAVADYHSQNPAEGGPYLSRVLAAWRDSGTNRGGANQLLREAWDDIPQPLQMAATAYEHGKLDQAAMQYRDILKKDPDNRLALLGTAMTLERQGHAEEARLTYERVLIVDPWNRPAMLAAMALVERGPTAAQLVRLLTLRQLSGHFPELSARIGMAYTERNSLEEAALYMAEAADLAPGEVRYRLNHALLSDRLGHSRQAMRSYQMFLASYRPGVDVLTVSLDSIRKRMVYLQTIAQ